MKEAGPDNDGDLLINRKSSVQSYSKGFHNTGEWNGCFINQKAVNRDPLPPGRQSAEKYLSFLLIKLQFVFHHPSLNLMARLNISYCSQGRLTSGQITSVGMSKAQNHQQKSGKGKWKEQITHCRLCLEMNNLNYDLKKHHLIADPACTCGYPYETAEHYLLYCPVIRKGTISTLHNSHTNIETLLRGDSNRQQQVDENIFATVHEFITQTCRF